MRTHITVEPDTLRGTRGYAVRFYDNGGSSTLARTRTLKAAKNLESKYLDDLARGYLMRPRASAYQG